MTILGQLLAAQISSPGTAVAKLLNQSDGQEQKVCICWCLFHVAIAHRCEWHIAGHFSVVSGRWHLPMQTSATLSHFLVASRNQSRDLLKSPLWMSTEEDYSSITRLHPERCTPHLKVYKSVALSFHSMRCCSYPNASAASSAPSLSRNATTANAAFKNDPKVEC